MPLLEKLKAFATECRRVLRVTKKPSTMEFKTIFKVAGVGMLLIGAVGFLLQMVRQLVS